MNNDKKTALFCWEIGEGLGHLTPIKQSALILQKKGYQCFLSTSNVQVSKSFLSGSNIEVIPTPQWRKPGSIKETPHPTHAHVFAECGLYEIGGIEKIVNFWNRIFNDVTPSIIVTDYAPVAALAAKIKGFKINAIGTGFTVLPKQQKSSEISKWHKQQYENVIEDFDKKVSKDLLNHSEIKNKLNHVSELFKGDNNIIINHNAMDCHDYRNEKEFKKLEPLGGIDLDIKSGFFNVFAYLKDSYIEIDSVMAQLDQSGFNIHCYFEGDSQRFKHCSRITFYNKPLDIEKVSNSCDLIVCHGGANLLTDAIKNKLRVVCLPCHQEQELNARLIKNNGFGDWLSDEQIEGLAFKLNKEFTFGKISHSELDVPLLKSSDFIDVFGVYID